MLYPVTHRVGVSPLKQISHDCLNALSYQWLTVCFIEFIQRRSNTFSVFFFFFFLRMIYRESGHVNNSC